MIILKYILINIIIIFINLSLISNFYFINRNSHSEDSKDHHKGKRVDVLKDFAK